jgi:hypothetical protein
MRGARALDEQPHRGCLGNLLERLASSVECGNFERGHGPDGFSVDSKRLSTGRHDVDPRTRARDVLNDFGARGSKVLAIVENDEELTRAESRDQGSQRRLIAVERGPHGGCNGRWHKRTLSQCRQLYQPHTMSEIRHRGARSRQRQARFADSTDPDECDNALLTEQLSNPASVLIASDERGERLGYVVTADPRGALHHLLPKTG